MCADEFFLGTADEATKTGESKQNGTLLLLDRKMELAIL